MAIPIASPVPKQVMHNAMTAIKRSVVSIWHPSSRNDRRDHNAPPKKRSQPPTVSIGQYPSRAKRSITFYYKTVYTARAMLQMFGLQRR